MTPKAITKSFDLGDGKEITIETGRFARQAHGSVVVRQNDTMIMCTVVSNYEAKPDAPFFPLTVEYQEKFASAGKIPGGFLKREGRAGDHEILICRLVDRAIRPLFPDGYMNDTQIMIQLISSDGEVMPDALACLAASAAIAVSDIPLTGLVSEARVARIDGKLVVNPYASELENADLDIIVGATKEDVCMVEGEMQEVSEEDLVEAIQLGHEAIKKMIEAQHALEELVGATSKREVVPVEVNEDLLEKIKAFAAEKISQVAHGKLGKHERKEQFSAIKEEFKAAYSEEELEEWGGKVSEYFAKVEKNIIRRMMLDEKTRLDGRNLDEIRAITIETDVLPRAHGSALFTRGETQSLTTATLGSKMDEKLIDTVSFSGTEKFMLHYNFPPYCTGEVKPVRGVSRREVGHGNLGFRSVKRILPEQDQNPYTIRVVSDILESNGSSSMATVCAGSLALMDAGIPVKGHVAGIAMGLISDTEPGSDKTAILTDILGDEDHLGDMDFKVTGTRNGIVACQMDMKIDGLKPELMVQALKQAKQAREELLEKMEAACPAPRAELKSFVPRMESLIIDGEFIGKIIGPGGKNIQDLQKRTNTVITIEEIEGEKGKVSISSSNGDDLRAAYEEVRMATLKPEIGAEYDSVVKKVADYGVFVEFLPGHQGLLHVSEISHSKIDKVADVFKEGDDVKIKIIGTDRKTGKFRLSRKVLLPKPEAPAESASE